MTKVKIAIGSQQKPIPLGTFNCTRKNGEINAYYNMDLGQNKQKMFSVTNNAYKDLRKLHFSFHHSGQGHLKESSGYETTQKGLFSDGSTLINQEEDLGILGIESIDLTLSPPGSAT